jgi:ribosomal protein S18 acetylase RimI-like enzyme
MIIEPFSTADIASFLTLAAAEGWVAESWEFEFLLFRFPEGCFTARGDHGETAGYVTSLRHGQSGWIGNLIVGTGYRGRGIGRALFTKALEALREDGAETVWLTASKSGMPLYQHYGFTRIDTINRWSGSGRQRLAGQAPEVPSVAVTPVLNDIDRRAWGDLRAALIAATAGRGKLLQQESGFVVVQPCGNARQLGPFSAPCYSTADSLLTSALNAIPCETKVYLDAPAANRTASLLFNRNRLRMCGSNELLYAGVTPAYRPELLYGLATMGSCG